MDALLVLEDGYWERGAPFGFPGEYFGEIVFNTCITGYQEILTDPSYQDQIIVFTYPQIGNYGVNTEDVESSRIFPSAIVPLLISRGPSLKVVEEALAGLDAIATPTTPTVAPRTIAASDHCGSAGGGEAAGEGDGEAAGAGRCRGSADAGRSPPGGHY